MAVPKYYELLNPALRAIRSLGGSAAIPELNEAVISSLKLSRADLAQSHGSRGTEIEYRLAWARSYLKSYGFLENSARGVWSLTPEGNRAGEVDPEAVKQFVRREHYARRKQRMEPESTMPSDDARIEDAATILEQSWREQLLALLFELRPSAFEKLCQRMLRESGFVKVEVTGRSGDGGIDGVGIVRIGGLLGFPILFQCKRYKGSVGASTIRDFRGAMIGRAERGLVITSGTFSRDARVEATRDGAPPIDLMDGEELLDKLKELRLGVSVKMIEEVSVEPLWFQTL